MRVVITGATGLIGQQLVKSLQASGDTPVVLSRSSNPLGSIEAHLWDPLKEPAPTAALEGSDAVVHLAGEPVAQRWNSSRKEAIRSSRVTGTKNLVEGIKACQNPPKVLISGSAVGYYGPRDAEELDETAPVGNDFLAGICEQWEAHANKAQEHGLRVVTLRTGIVLSNNGGALKKMLPPFKLGIGGPIGNGKHFMPWIHIDDVVGIILQALSDERWSGPINLSAPNPVTNREFSKTLGKVLKRPAFAPLPAAVLKLLYGEMATILTTGQRAVPSRALDLGYSFKHPELAESLNSLLR